MLSARCQTNEWRHRWIDRTLQSGNHCADRGPPAHRPQRILRPTRIALNRVVPAARTDDRTHEHALVGDTGDLRERFANLNAGNFGGDRLEFAAYFLGCVGLEVPHVLMRRPAAQENIDYGLVRMRAAGHRFRAGNLREIQVVSAKRKCTDLEKGPSGNAVAQPLRTAEDRQHEETLSDKGVCRAGKPSGGINYGVSAPSVLYIRLIC